LSCRESGGRLEDSSVESGASDTEAGSDLCDRDVGGLEQSPDGFDLLWRQLNGTSSLAAASASGRKASNGSFAD